MPAMRTCPSCGKLSKITSNFRKGADVCRTCRSNARKVNRHKTKYYVTDLNISSSPKIKRVFSSNVWQTKVTWFLASCKSRGTAFGNEGVGTITANALWRKAEMQNWKCLYCGKPLAESTIVFDHSYPLAKGGQHVTGNIVISCDECNSEKHDHTLKDYCHRKNVDFLSLYAAIDAINIQLELEGYTVWDLPKVIDGID